MNRILPYNWHGYKIAWVGGGEQSVISFADQVHRIFSSDRVRFTRVRTGIKFLTEIYSHRNIFVWQIST